MLSSRSWHMTQSAIRTSLINYAHKSQDDASGSWSNVSFILYQHKKSLFLTSLGSQSPSWPVEPPPLSPRAVSSPPPSSARGPPSPLPTQTSRLSVGRTKVHHYQFYSLHGSKHTRWTARLSWGGDKDKHAGREGVLLMNVQAWLWEIFMLGRYSDAYFCSPNNSHLNYWFRNHEPSTLVLTYRVLWWLATLCHIIRNKLWQLIFRTNVSLRIPIRYNTASGGKWVGENGKSKMFCCYDIKWKYLVA